MCKINNLFVSKLNHDQCNVTYLLECSFYNLYSFSRISDEWIELSPQMKLTKQVKVCHLSVESKCRLEQHLYGKPGDDSSANHESRKLKASRKASKVQVPSIWQPPPPKGLFWITFKTRNHKLYVPITTPFLLIIIITLAFYFQTNCEKLSRLAVVPI